MSGYVYMLRCGDGSLYTGWTTNIDERVAQHAVGRGGKYTRSRLPVELVYVEKLATPTAARQREYAIKQLAREGKLALFTK
jgi:putative endonuclease